MEAGASGQDSCRDISPLLHEILGHDDFKLLLNGGMRLVHAREQLAKSLVPGSDSTKRQPCHGVGRLTSCSPNI